MKNPFLTLLFLSLGISIVLSVIYSPKEYIQAMWLGLIIILVIVKSAIQLLFFGGAVILLIVLAIPLKVLLGDWSISAYEDLIGIALSVVEGIYLGARNFINAFAIESAKVIGLNVKLPPATSNLTTDLTLEFSYIQTIFSDFFKHLKELYDDIRKYFADRGIFPE